MILYWRDTKNGNMKYNGPPRQGVIEVHHHLLVVKLTYHAGQLGLLRIGKRKDQPFLQRQVSAKLRPGHVLHIAGIVLEEGLRSEEHTSELQSRGQLVCRLLLEK